MNIIVRSETIDDYHQIAQIHAMAFSNSSGMEEAALVSLHRNRRQHDPDLSLVAVHENQIIGHVLFHPRKVMVGGHGHKAVILAPIAVQPEYQNSGIGRKLIEEGLERAEMKGYAFSILLGHPSYYPRFGYQTNMFGICGIKIMLNESKEAANIVERKATCNDLGKLSDLWDQWFDDVDLAMYPGDDLTDWLSPDKKINCSVFEINNKFAGYVRYEKDQPENVKMFLATDKHAAQEILKTLSMQIDNQNAIFLPVHPESNKTIEVFQNEGQTDCKTWEAAMIRVLDKENKQIADYCNEVKNHQRLPGLLSWPVEFDVC
ncbi:GNAT family N-acetyltransferase [Pseudalkalibacillus caeni]|uniref:GNAT family N-acetyltransferase n=1 Tax=Exobacillus caeni TaxID=2574798 RepID=UPI001485199A|nr:GNAT family N-acetyltransferase [Pseudalkalibacillus caeni]